MKKLAFVIIIACLVVASCKREDEPPTIYSTVEDVEATADATSCIICCTNKSVDGSEIKMKLLLSETESMQDAKSFVMQSDAGILSYRLNNLQSKHQYYYSFELSTDNDQFRIKTVYSFRTISPYAPKVTTTDAVNITNSSAVCGGVVTDDGGRGVSERGILWSTGNALSYNYHKVVIGNGTGGFSTTLTNLESNHTYCYKAYAINSADTAYGNVVKFTTGADTPVVTTASATNITSTTATCGGNVTSDGGATISARGVCWSTSPNPTISDNHTTNGTGTGSFTSNITGLTAGITYYVRAYATNTSGTGYGNQISFTTTTPLPEGALSGVFSVGTRQVRFSRGNLQYTTTGTHSVAGGNTRTGTWRFANNQWDIIGSANSNISSAYTGWIDLFGWGTSGYSFLQDQYITNYYPYSSNTSIVNATYNYYGYGPSTNMSDPNLTGTSANYDWGVYNAISNGGNQPGLWRTLTQTEWNTLINLRNTNSGIRYAKATVNGVSGLIIVPDNWSASTYTLNSTNTTSSSYTANVISSSQWTTLENAGCVFLPAAGIRNGTRVDNVGNYGNYWSTTSNGSSTAYTLYFTANSMSEYNMTLQGCSRYQGVSIRLVKDI